MVMSTIEKLYLCTIWLAACRLKNMNLKYNIAQKNLKNYHISMHFLLAYTNKYNITCFIKLNHINVPKENCLCWNLFPSIKWEKFRRALKEDRKFPFPGNLKDFFTHGKKFSLRKLPRSCCSHSHCWKFCPNFKAINDFSQKCVEISNNSPKKSQITGFLTVKLPHSNHTKITARWLKRRQTNIDARL